MDSDGIDRRTALVAPVLLLAPASVSAEAGRTAEAALLAFLHAFEDCDLPRMESAFAPDATHFDRAPLPAVDTLEPYKRGRGMPPGMRQLAMELPKTRPGPPYHEVRPVMLLTQSAGQVAICTFHLETANSLGRRTVILEPRSDGWKIVHIHASNIEQGPAKWHAHLLKRRQFLMDEIRYVATHNTRLEETTDGKRTDVTADWLDRLQREYAEVSQVLIDAGILTEAEVRADAAR